MAQALDSIAPAKTSDSFNVERIRADFPVLHQTVNGKVFVREGAQKTDAMQTNKNLLLSQQARVDTKPQLEIYADDVKCAHGAAVGQIDEEELFYLQARGINPELGRSLLTYGFAEEVIGKIKIDSIRSQLDEIVLRQLNTRLEGSE